AAVRGAARPAQGRAPAGRLRTGGAVLMPERVTPATVDELAAVLRDPDAGAVCVRGGGTKRHWGAPPSACDVILETGRLDRVVDHAAGDMVVEVEAGVRLDRLAQVLAGAGQQLALDVPSYDDGTSLGAGTVGGALAVGLSGPGRWRCGAVRGPAERVL